MLGGDAARRKVALELARTAVVGRDGRGRGAAADGAACAYRLLRVGGVGVDERHAARVGRRVGADLQNEPGHEKDDGELRSS